MIFVPGYRNAVQLILRRTLQGSVRCAAIWLPEKNAGKGPGTEAIRILCHYLNETFYHQFLFLYLTQLAG